MVMKILEQTNSRPDTARYTLLPSNPTMSIASTMPIASPDSPALAILPPPVVSLDHAPSYFQTHGFVVLDATAVMECFGVTSTALAHLATHWDDLPPDRYLKDGGRYRQRRHGSWVVEADKASPVPHRPHWQPLSYNALHGGMQRWFAPLQADLAQAPALHRLMRGLAVWGDVLHGPRPWFTEVHAFRIDTMDGIGRPTPEGAHRDGVELVAVFMLQRHRIKGGETRVFEATGPNGQRFTLSQPWSMLLLDDHRVIHESTPIQPAFPECRGWRDTLVITLRADGFLEAQDVQTSQNPPACR
jgi:hypothetical protein